VYGVSVTTKQNLYKNNTQGKNMLELNKEEFKLWLEHPTTEKIRAALIESRNDYARALIDGSTIFNDPGATQKNTAQSVGVIQGIDMFLNFEVEANNGDDL
jgi:hypothetical protein